MREPQRIERLGASFARVCIARALAPGSWSGADKVAAERWPGTVAAGVLFKAASAITAADVGAAIAAVRNEFFASVVETSILGKLEERRRASFEETKLTSVTSGAVAYWSGQGTPKPVSVMSFDGSSLAPRKAVGIIVVTKESLRHGPVNERQFQDDLRRAVAAIVDTALVDPDNGGDTDTPASITNGVTAISSSGNPAVDIAAAVAAFGGDLGAAYWATDPVTAVALALYRDAGGQFPFADVTARGGVLAGLPLIVSRSSPRASSGGQIALIDASGLAVAEGGVEVDVAQHASISFAAEPGGSDPGELQSLWQRNLLALRAEVFVNWSMQRAGGVACVTGCDYAIEVGS